MLLLDAFVGAFIAPETPIVYDRVAAVSRDFDRRPACRDRLALMLARVGWHGRQNRTAWAIVQRESNGRADVVSGGAYGLFQLQASVWAGTSIWPDDPLDAEDNARAARKLWKRSGWRPWGITADGTGMDARDYGGWDSSTQWSWIWAPYAMYRDAYPCEVAP